MATSDKKLDAILNRLEAMDTKLDEYNSAVQRLTTTVNTIRSDVDDHTRDIAELREELNKYKTDNREVRGLKEQLNHREQQIRNSTIRIFNLRPLRGESIDNYKGLSARVYDKIIRPVLIAAKTAGDLGSVPQVQDAIDGCYRVFSPTEPDASRPPSPVVVKFFSHGLKAAFMKHRKNIPLPSEEERAAGSRRYVAVEDLTPAAHKLLKDMQQDSRVAKVWSVNGRIHYKLSGRDEVSRVKSVISTVAEILGPVQ